MKGRIFLWIAVLTSLLVSLAVIAVNQRYTEPEPVPVSGAPIQPVLPFDSPPVKKGVRKSFRRQLSQQTGKIADRIVQFAHQFMGTPYFFTGKSARTGFDCSGFTSYIFTHFGIDVPQGSKSQVNSGYQVPVDEARKGDLLIFTGVDASVREPGHVGIVISDGGHPIRFIHSSSNGGVKISQVDDTRYELRLLQVRRVIDNRLSMR